MQKVLVTPNFIDHHPKYNAGGYVATNEEPERFNEMLRGVKVDRAACIASGGDILLSTILPIAREVVAVDHGYSALAITYWKLLLLQEMPFSKVRKMLRADEFKEVNDHFTNNKKQLPSVLQKAEAYSWDLPSFKMRGNWNYFSVPRFAKKKVSNVTLIHGDLRDLKELYEPFDLFYASNAMEHWARDKKKPTIDDVAALVRPGGLLLYTVGSKQHQPEERLFELVNKVWGYRTSWLHVVVRKKQQ